MTCSRMLLWAGWTRKVNVASETLERKYVYGNYIDEVLMMDDASSAAECDYYYRHDHLYSRQMVLTITAD